MDKNRLGFERVVEWIVGFVQERKVRIMPGDGFRHLNTLGPRQGKTLSGRFHDMAEGVWNVMR
jgi:hypothetical protein